VHDVISRVVDDRGVSMRIAIVAPPWLGVPPPGYGGTENVLDTLARGLKAGGHDVLLCTTGDSTCPVEKTSVFPTAIGVGSGSSVDEIRHVIHSYEAIEKWGADVVHDHTLVGPLYSAANPGVAVVTTNHGPFNADLTDLYRVLSARMAVIAISHHQARTAREVKIAAVIHHGVNLEDFPVGEGEGGYALFLGRMHPGKAPHVAARLAREAGVELRIAAKMDEPAERAYFQSMVRPLLGGGVSFLGEVGWDEKRRLLAGASCLLNPIAWAEPFGMVMIEALACGTPVVTTPFGAAPEIVEDGVVGYVRASERELTEVLARVGQIDRHACRKRVAQHFSVELMVAKHCAVYSEAIGASSRRRSLEILVPGAA
jgi:glycosyltransferase involved in cell wall biosynthesis